MVTLAALLNACRLTGPRHHDVRALIVGVGAAGVAVAKILRAAGVRDIVGCDSRGALHPGREDYAALLAARSAGSRTRRTPRAAPARRPT